MSSLDQLISYTDFEPPLWAKGPHAQTILANKMRRTDGIFLQRDKFDTPDGDFLVLDHALPFEGARISADAPLLLCLHGLEGSAAGVYMLETYRQALPVGFRPIGMNFRTCGGEMNLTWRMYNAGATDDVDLAVQHILKSFPQAKSIAIIGFSLGGNMLIKYLGEGRKLPSKLEGAVAISPPFDMNLGIQKLLTGMGWFYGYRFLRTLKAKTKMKEHLVKDRVDVKACYSAKTLLEFDDVGTSQLYGYRDAADYYTKNECHQFLDTVEVPTLLIRSIDDPFMDPNDIPHKIIAQNKNLYANITQVGGHVGFMAPNRQFWAESTALNFLKKMVEFGQ